MPNFIKLPSERVEQLRALAENLNLSMADCIGMFINEQIEKGNLDASIPGIQVLKNGGTIQLQSSEIDRTFSKDEAIDISKSIRAILTPASDNPFMRLPEGFGLARRGTSLKLQDTAKGTEKTIAPSIANDLADILEQTASS